MILSFESDGNIGIDDAENAAKNAILSVLKEFSIPDDYIEISVTVTDSDSVRALNKEHRGMDDTTDVLSFPMYELKAGEYDTLNDMLSDIHTIGGSLLLGDIVLNNERVISQADEYGHSVLREYSFLIVHSMLHLLGYDHIKEDDRLMMEEKQRVIMDALGITRNE